MLSRDNPIVQCLHCNSFYVPGQPNHDRARIEELTDALKNARNYIDAVVVNTPDQKKRRNYSDCLRSIDAALASKGGVK